MTQRVSTAVHAGSQIPVRAIAKPVTPEGPRSATSTDRLSLVTPASAALIAAHVQFTMTGGTAIAANGTVDLQHVFVERLIKMALAGNSKTPPDVAYDPKAGRYRVSATLRVKGLDVPFEVHVKPLVSDREVAFQLDDVTLKVAGGLHPRFLTTEAATVIAKKLNENGFRARADGHQGLVRLDTSRLLQRIGALPYGVSIDTKKTTMGVVLSPAGDVQVRFKSPQGASAQASSKDSDLTMSVDGEALRQVLAGVLSPSYDVQKVTVRNGSLQVDGRAEFEQGSNFVTAVRFLGALLVNGSAGTLVTNPDPEPVDVKLPLSLTIRPSGQDLLITPSLSQALGSITDALKNAGLDPLQEGDHVRIPLNAFWKGRDAAFTSVQFGPDRMVVKAHLNIDSFISSPALKGPS